MSNNIPLGKNPSESAKRDAVHIAIAPCVAKEQLEPGQHVGADGSSESPHVGIVDPFLEKPVRKGKPFWLCLYPNTVTSLRHEWTHPAFGAEGKANADWPNFTEEDCEHAGKPTRPPRSVPYLPVEYSRQWLQRYAERMNIYDDPKAAYKRLIDGLRSGELCARGTNLHGLYELDDADELREHAERVLGIKIDWEQFEFSCSC